MQKQYFRQILKMIVGLITVCILIHIFFNPCNKTGPLKEM